MYSNLRAKLGYARRHMLCVMFKDRLMNLCHCATGWGWGVYYVCRDDIADFREDVGEEIP